MIHVIYSHTHIASGRKYVGQTRTTMLRALHGGADPIWVSEFDGMDGAAVGKHAEETATMRTRWGDMRRKLSPLVGIRTKTDIDVRLGTLNGEEDRAPCS